MPLSKLAAITGAMSVGFRINGFLQMWLDPPLLHLLPDQPPLGMVFSVRWYKLTQKREINIGKFREVMEISLSSLSLRSLLLLFGKSF